MIHDDMIGANNHQSGIAGQFLRDSSNSTEFITERDAERQQFPTDLSTIDTSDLIVLRDDMTDRSLIGELFSREGDMILQDTVPQPVLNAVPNLDEHNDGGMNFELDLNPHISGKNDWYFSPKLQKVFIKLDKAAYIEVSYKPRVQNEILYLRAMMVYVNQIISPVQRCNNHLCKDPSTEENIRHSVLRCENANAIYEGTRDGKNVNDRLSVRIPLGFEKPNEQNKVRQSVAFKFVCQNSCIGRQPTAVIFTLENVTKEVLGKRVFYVKVCSCPKRDKLKDEEKFKETKRELEDGEYPPGKKPAKMIKIKEEPESSSPTSQPPIDVTFGSTGVKLYLELPNIASARHVVTCAYNDVAGQMAYDPNNAEKYSKYLRDLRKTLEKFTHSSP